MFGHIPLPFRLVPVQEGAFPLRSTHYFDTTTYRAPVPYGAAQQMYQTYWSGNILPGTLVSNLGGPNWYMRVNAPPLSQQPQRAVGSFGQVLGQIQSRLLAAQWGQTWGS